ncbi:Fanconi anemia group F protein [Salminus brasiliensis]|uniref:Fanconi anemia group F protein n=1 Tax=Salminus brasiliensis TaxID=930266 RepID=UPI003B82D4AB
MEAVVKNLGSTLELLAVSQTEFVSEWDAQTVDRAFQWAKYCEHIYSRFHANPSVRPVLEDCLRLTNERLSEALSGHHSTPLSLADLAQCRHRLFIGLVRNPLAPYSVVKTLFDRLFDDDDGDTKPDTETDPDLAGLIMCKSACKVLGSFPLKPQETSGLGFDTQVHGLMLLQRIHSIQSRPGNESYLKTLMDAVLQDAGGLDHFSDVIAASLLVEDSTNVDTAAAQDFLLDWLQGHHSLLHSMCQKLPLELCTKLAQKQTKFRLLYWDVLKNWVSSMEYDVSGGVWVQQCDSHASFKTLVDHLKSLWRSGSSLKEETEKELGVLKQADGDFEVQGLSVWTDLLLQLR